jgi:hypothetical protein
MANTLKVRTKVVIMPVVYVMLNYKITIYSCNSIGEIFTAAGKDPCTHKFDMMG